MIGARAAIVLAVGATACLDVSPEHKCSETDHCPAPGRCELVTGNCSAPDESCGLGGFRYDERSGERSGTCIVAATGPVDTLAAIDLVDQDDSTATGCAPDGARDAFIEIDSPLEQLIFVITDPTMPIAAALIVRAGACPGGSPISECTDHPCPPSVVGMLLAQIPSGRSCLVVEAADGATTGSIRVMIYPSLRRATGIAPGAVLPEQTTCTGIENPTPMCGAPAGTQSAAYVFPICPGGFFVNATIAPEAPLDALVGMRQLIPYNPSDLACENDGTGQATEAIIDQAIAGPSAYWIVVEAAAGGACGPFTLASFMVTPQSS